MKKVSRRETMQFAAGAAGLSLGALAPSQAGAVPPQESPSQKPVAGPRQSPAINPRLAQQTPPPVPDRLVDTQLRNIASLPLKPDGSAPEYAPQEAGQITGVLWRTKNQTPEIEFDYRKMKVRLDARGTAKLSGTLTFGDIEKLPRHSYVTLLQCGAPTPRGIVKWTGVRFSDFAQMVGMQNFASYGRLVGSDAYFIDEDMSTLMHPQVVLAWLLNDQPIPPQHGAPLRLIIPFRYGARSIKAIQEIHFTATTFAPPKPWQT